jgi:lysophospholipase L1-like esterase
MHRGRDIVINTAVSGDKADDLLHDFGWRVDHLHPDVVSLMIGMNDSVRGVDGELIFEANLQHLIDKIRAIGAIPIIHTTNWTLDDPQRHDLPHYNLIIRRVAALDHVTLIDNWQYWQQRRTKDDLGAWLGNPIHPNGVGHAEIAHQMFLTLGIYDPSSPMCQLGNP